METSTFAIFPGQGSQQVGMGKDLYDNFKVAKECFEEASDAISKDLAKLCFEGPNEELMLTENTQPCLLVASVAAYRVAEKELGFRPTGVAGHSLGEYSALVAAGALPLSTTIMWVRERGRAMQSAVPAGQGGMAAILGLSSTKYPGEGEETLISRLCEQATELARSKRQVGAPAELSVEAIVEPANFNSPGQIVLAGSADAIAEAITLAKSGEDFSGKAIALTVSAPFHCKLMSPARNRMAELFSQAKPHEKPKSPLFPYVPNRTARLTYDPGLIFDFLVEQVDHPVLWKQSISAVLESGQSSFVEFGPGKVLSGLLKRIAQPLGKEATATQVGDSAQLKAFEEKLKGKDQT